jgi:hypothetical protein
MANISDVYDINFEASTDELAEVLEQYIKIADQDAYYNLAGDLSRYGKIIAGGYASGRWVYSTNLEGAFERPEQWLAGDKIWGQAKPVFNKLKRMLKAGETITVSYSEDESGCEVYQDAYGEIGYNQDSKSVYVSLDLTEHDRPDCVMSCNPDGTWYCEDHDHEQAEEAKYCEVAE